MVSAEMLLMRIDTSPLARDLFNYRKIVGRLFKYEELNFNITVPIIFLALYI